MRVRILLKFHWCVCVCVFLLAVYIFSQIARQIQIGLYFYTNSMDFEREGGLEGYFLVYFYLVRHLIHSFTSVLLPITGGYANISHGKIRST